MSSNSSSILYENVIVNKVNNVNNKNNQKNIYANNKAKSNLKTLKKHVHSVIYDYEKGEKLCNTCGLIMQDKVYDSELDTECFRHRNSSKSSNNTAMPYSILLNDKEMSTTISEYKESGKNRFANQKQHNKMEFLNKIVSCSNQKRNLKIVIDLLNRLKDKLSLTSFCIEEGMYYYKKAFEMGLIKGRSIKEMVIACMYIVCKKNNVPRTLTEISKMVNANATFASRCYRLLMREFKISHIQFNPVIFIRKIANQAKIKEITARESMDILMAIQYNNAFAGKDPLSIAAAVLYITCKKHKPKISQAKIAYAANINIMTLRKRLDEVNQVMAQTALLS